MQGLVTLTLKLDYPCAEPRKHAEQTSLLEDRLAAEIKEEALKTIDWLYMPHAPLPPKKEAAESLLSRLNFVSIEEHARRLRGDHKGILVEGTWDFLDKMESGEVLEEPNRRYEDDDAF